MSDYLSHGANTTNKIKAKTARPLTHKIDERVPLKTLLKNLYACWYCNSVFEAARMMSMNPYSVYSRLGMLEKEYGVVIFNRDLCKTGFNITEDGLALIDRYIRWGKSPLLMKGC